MASFYGAGDEARTRYLHLGKVALYRMSYTRGTSGIIADILNKSIAFLKNLTLLKNKHSPVLYGGVFINNISYTLRTPMAPTVFC